MAPTVRAKAATVERASIRTSVRVTNSRQTRHAPVAATAMVTRTGAASPAESMISTSIGTGKRKEREFELDGPAGTSGGEETFINVVVRCRGRSDREVRENSNVVVVTEGVKGNLVHLTKGPNALSNKTYNFDRVFSPAADQSMIFDDVVKPILEEMLAGYNCTIFAYGQTGTGKTYTMSGDVSETLGMLPDAAGIIPRVLQELFKKLEVESTDSFVKVSFVELYNEELRDLVSVEETARLKIYDDTSRKGHAATMVQGMEEKHIRNAVDGIRVLQEGSLKRQVAATKCNDLSSRSHTIFTITAYVRVAASREDGADEFVQAGKLNLVDLAGSENIQRSGAENKRAAEAGLINKSLLTLGRVINALVDHSAHIPYRESKLTRLLQDSLGGRTKTCIIATISPAKSNLEETMSTLDYAFRGKNIQNKPQRNQPVNKKMLLKDFALEVEKLKSELICHRQRSGVYLSNDAYEDLTAVSESRRIVLEEQVVKMGTLETSLRNKSQELFALTAAFLGLKKDHDETKAQLEEAQGVVDETELVLCATRTALSDETDARKRHQRSADRLARVGGELTSTLHQTVEDIGGLHARIERATTLHGANRAACDQTRAHLSDVSGTVEARVLALRDQQARHIQSVQGRLISFVRDELAELASTQGLFDRHFSAFDSARQDLGSQGIRSREELDQSLVAIGHVRTAVKEKVGLGLEAISFAAARLANGFVKELGSFDDQLQSSYSHLGSEIQSVFNDLARRLADQRMESARLRTLLEAATQTTAAQNDTLAQRLQAAMEAERRQADHERRQLLVQMTSLVKAQGEAQSLRLDQAQAALKEDVAISTQTLSCSVERFANGMDAWDRNEGVLLDHVADVADTLATRLQDGRCAASDQITSLRSAAQVVYAHTSGAVHEQVAGLDAHMQALDDVVSLVRANHAHSQDGADAATEAISVAVQAAREVASHHVDAASDRLELLRTADAAAAHAMATAAGAAIEACAAPLASLRRSAAAFALTEYAPTGATPPRTHYRVPATPLPADGGGGPSSPTPTAPVSSPARPEMEVAVVRTSLCELDPNLVAEPGRVEVKKLSRRRLDGRENALELREERTRKSQRLAVV